MTHLKAGVTHLKTGVLFLGHREINLLIYQVQRGILILYKTISNAQHSSEFYKQIELIRFRGLFINMVH